MKAGYNVFDAKIIQYIFEKIKLLFSTFFGSIESYKVRKLLGGVILKRGTQNTIY